MNVHNEVVADSANRRSFIAAVLRLWRGKSGEPSRRTFPPISSSSPA